MIELLSENVLTVYKSIPAQKNRAIPLSEFRAEEATIARFLSRQSTLITSMWKNASQRVIDFELGVTHHTEHTMAYMPRSSR